MQFSHFRTDNFSDLYTIGYQSNTMKYMIFILFLLCMCISQNTYSQPSLQFKKHAQKSSVNTKNSKFIKGETRKRR